MPRWVVEFAVALASTLAGSAIAWLALSPPTPAQVATRLAGMRAAQTQPGSSAYSLGKAVQGMSGGDLLRHARSVGATLLVAQDMTIAFVVEPLVGVDLNGREWRPGVRLIMVA